MSEPCTNFDHWYDADKAVAQAAGKVITGIVMSNNRGSEERLVLTFEDESTLSIFDGGQSCCESRYMTCDDDLASFVGGELRGVWVKDGSSEDEEYGNVHEVQFLEVTTTKGDLIVATHNDHNGYYGGFSLRAAFEV